MTTTSLDSASLVAVGAIDFEPHAVPSHLADLVNTFLVIRSDADQLNEMMPAYSAQLMILVSGSIELQREDGQSFRSQLVTCTAPLMRALPAIVRGPLLLVGASLTPLGWQCLSRTPADELNNCMVPVQSLFQPEALSRLKAAGELCTGTDAEIQAIFDVISDLLDGRREVLRSGHIEFVGQVMQWLAGALIPEVDDLYAGISLSPRTAQRLSKRYFGVSPSRLAKRYRAIRAAMMLANPDLPAAIRDEILDGYYDQAHLIRDIRRYTGRTPTGLQDESIMSGTLDPEAHGEGARILRGD